MFSRIIYTILVITLWSCDQFTLVKKEKKEDIIEEEWEKIDKNAIEEPPLFAVCTMVSESKQDSCFAYQLYHHIENSLKNESLFYQSSNKTDTLYINLLIDKNASITYEDFKLPPYLKNKYPDFKLKLNEGIKALPKLLPATKRGVPTNIKYRLPILIPAE